jgi:holo-[acyl-carrier protein] synthase
VNWLNLIVSGLGVSALPPRRINPRVAPTQRDQLDCWGHISCTLWAQNCFRNCFRRGWSLRPDTNHNLTTMIVGTGIDIAEVPRIAEAIARYGDRFLRKIFTEGEIRYCSSKANRVERFAARFAAKEAAMKALGTGWNHGVRFRDVEVSRQPGKRPTITFHGKAAEFADKLGAKNIALSLSHTAEQAIAQVILEN